MLDIIDKAEASSLWADQATSPRAAFACKDTLPSVSSLSVCAEEVADFAASDADIARGYVRVSTCRLSKQDFLTER